MNDEIEEAARTLWDYHCIYDPLEPCGAIICLGSYDLRVAERSAELFTEGYAQSIVFTGSAGNWTRDRFERSEAATFADCAMAHGVPESAILLEERATNIGENIRFSARMLLPNQPVILVTKPQTQRRCCATARKQWSEGRHLITAPRHSFAEQSTKNFPLEHLINEMVGDFFRMQTYADVGYQIPQPTPPHAVAAYDFLMQRGFTAHLPDRQ